MAVKRMDNVGIVVEDIEAAIEFFTELGLELEGRAPIEGDWAGGVTGLLGMRVEIAMMRTPDGHSRIELSRFLVPPVVPRLLALARARGWRTLPLLSTHDNTYDRDYFSDSSGLPAAVLKQQKFRAGEEWDMPMLNVFQRRGKVIRHFWGSELLYVPPEPGQEYRHNDALDSLWNMLDLTPAGRGDFHPQLSYPAINSKATRHRQRV